jgi:murein DD-endopeptidase MepM/ murein hydrolase activator NlpD
MLSISFLTIVFFAKYKPVYKVTVAGSTLGYVKEKTDFENKLTEYINHREGTIVLIDIENMPEYSLSLISRSMKTSEDDILDTIEQTAVITYKTYAITVNGETINEVDTEAEAQEIISNLQTDLQDGVEFELGMAEIYKTEQTSVSEETALSQLNEIKLAKTTEYEEEQARIEAERIAAEEAAKAEAARKAALAYSSSSSLATSTGSGNISGISISNPLRIGYLVTSRFGEVSSRRSSTHTGLDLAVSLGTPIYPISSGTVTFAGWQGSYGNMVIIDHGDGIQSWYAHCNSIIVSVGDTVTTDTNIATVGNTGNSTGPHLHLEIRVNGNAVNPQNYLY